MRKKTKENPAIALARDLSLLHDELNAQSTQWNPDHACLVRIEIDSPMTNTVAMGSAVRGFCARLGFALAGSMTPTVRIFRTKISTLRDAADSLEAKRTDRRGNAFLEKYAGIHLKAAIRDHVYDATLRDRPLEICYDSLDGATTWTGISRMLEDLGAHDMRTRTDVGLGYAWVSIDHALASQIAEHPLIRHIGVSSALRRSNEPYSVLIKA